MWLLLPMLGQLVGGWESNISVGVGELEGRRLRATRHYTAGIPDKQELDTCNCHFDLVLSCFVTEDRWDPDPQFAASHKRYSRFSVFMYMLRTLAYLPIKNAYFYIELSEQFKPRRGQLHTAIRQLFGSRVATLEGFRPTTQAAWGDAIDQSISPPGRRKADDDAKRLIYFLQNDDHPFIDFNTEVLCEGIARMRHDNSKFKTLYMSHWASALNLVGKLDTPVQRGSYLVGHTTQVDSVQVMNLGYLRYLLQEVNWEGKEYKRIDMLVRHRGIYKRTSIAQMATDEKLQAMYVPLRELCRKFDGYEEMGIPRRVSSELQLPPEANQFTAEPNSLIKRIKSCGDTQWAQDNPFRIGPTLVRKMLELYFTGGQPPANVRACGELAHAPAAQVVIPDGADVLPFVHKWKGSEKTLLSAMADTWLEASIRGKCVVEEGAFGHGSCEHGNHGSWQMRKLSTDALPRTPKQPWTTRQWKDASMSCLQMCLQCQRCRYFSVSVNNPCSWSHDCELSPAQGKTLGYRSGALPGSAIAVRLADKITMPGQCKPLTPAANQLVPDDSEIPPASSQTKSPHAKRAPIDDLRCSERFSTVLHCAGRVFFFTRHDMGNNREMQTLVRMASRSSSDSVGEAGDDSPRKMHTGKKYPMNGGKMHPMNAGKMHPMNPGRTKKLFNRRNRRRLLSRDELLFSAPLVTLPHTMLMSHNAAFTCLNDRHLVAYGGMAHTAEQADWQGNDVGITRSTADASEWPLKWSTPVPTLSGDPDTGCVDTNSEVELCEYDGKVSVVHFKGRTYLYSRSNLGTFGGARHVQVASSPHGLNRWTKFQQLQIDGYHYGAGRAKNNIYYATVRQMPSQPDYLVMVFPGVIEMVGGLFYCVSTDGLRWTSPVRLMSSEHDVHMRTKDHPVDGLGFDLSTLSSPNLQITVQHNVDVREEGINDHGCSPKPYMCSYTFDSAKMLREARRLSSLDHTNVSTLPSSSSGDAGCAKEDVGTPKFDQVRAYLSAVYPAATRSINSLNPAGLRAHFESLDYFFNCDPEAFKSVYPRLRGCARLSRTGNFGFKGLVDPPPLPFLPRGAYYRTGDLDPMVKQLSVGVRRKRFKMWAASPQSSAPEDYWLSPSVAMKMKPFADGSYDRYTKPIQIVEEAISGRQLHGFHSQTSAKLGPAPSWSSPAAILRYPLFPNGLMLTPNQELTGERPTRWNGVPPQDGSSFFFVKNMRRVNKLLRIQDGDLIEVENWGGWAERDCPPICGFWGNIWKGTGIAMRVKRPFASLTKITAIVEMILKLGRTNQAALLEFARVMKVELRAEATRAKYPESSLAECVAFLLLTSGHPCEGTETESMSKTVSHWLPRRKHRSPSFVVAELLGIGKESSARFMQPQYMQLLWAFSVCGAGPFYGETGVGWDGMLAMLACILGHNTIILASSANDNGLYHQEFVDYDLPQGIGWGAPGANGTNNVRWCAKPFPFAQQDRGTGIQAVQSRRREFLRYWQRIGKFTQPFQDTAEFVMSSRSADKNSKCELRFGPTDPAGEVHNCELTPEDEKTQPTAEKACYMWCDGGMSQAHSTVSLFHVAIAPATPLQQSTANKECTSPLTSEPLRLGAGQGSASNSG